MHTTFPACIWLELEDKVDVVRIGVIYGSAAPRTKRIPTLIFPSSDDKSFSSRSEDAGTT